MAQPYQSRVAKSKEEMLLNNETPGAKHIAYFETPGGFKCSVNGCEFRELTLMIEQTDKRTGVVTIKEQQIVEGELLRPDGTRCWVYQGMGGWKVDAHNAHAMQAMVKTYNEGEKARRALALGALAEQVKTLKAANLPSVAIQAALVAQGVDSVTAAEAIKAVQVS